jgi:hypothetical protein
MKISPYTSYLELQPNALLVRQIFYYLQKVGVTICAKYSGVATLKTNTLEREEELRALSPRI